MKKYYVVKDKKPIDIGDVITVKEEETYSFGKCVTVISETLTKDNVQKYIKKGVIAVYKEPKSPFEKHDLSYYIELLAKTCGLPMSEMVKVLDKLNTINPEAVFKLLIKVIADDLNKPKIVLDTIYVISHYDYGILEIELSSHSALIPYYTKNGGFFHTREQAEYALDLLNIQHSLAYGK